MRGGKLRIQTAAFCLFMFISLFYRRRYCFSGATEKAKGGREGGRSCFAFVGNVRPALLFLHLFFFFSPSTRLLFPPFSFFHRLTRPAPSSSSLLLLFFFSLFLLLFFPTPLYSRNTSRGDWQQRAWSIGRSWTSGGLSCSLWFAYYSLGIVGSFLVNRMRLFFGESILVEKFFLFRVACKKLIWHYELWNDF